MPDTQDDQTTAEAEGQTDAGSEETLEEALGAESGGEGQRLETALAEAGAEGETVEAPEEDLQAEETETEPRGEEPQPESDESEDEPEPTEEGEHAPEYLRWQADGDPEGTYRDAQGRLHDEETGEFLKGETKEPPEYVTEVAEEELSDEEIEEFWEGEDAPEPIELEVEGEDGESETFELAVEDEETRDLLEERLQAAEEAEEIRAENEELKESQQKVEALQEELNAVVSGIEEDPSYFILQNLDASTDTRKKLARDLLLDDDVFEALNEQIQNWQVNPSERRVAKAERKAEMAERKTNQYESRTRRQRAMAIHNRIDQMVPEDLDRGEPEMLKDRIALEIERALSEKEGLADQINEDNFTNIDGVRELLSVYGVDPDAALGTTEGESPNGSSPDVVEAEPAGEQEERTLAERAEIARRTGVRLRKKREQREDAASTTPAGAGASPSSGEMPDDATLDDAIEELDRRAG